MSNINRILSISIAGIAVLSLGGCAREQAKAGPAGPPVMAVSVAKATKESVPTELKVVGTVDASSVVQVKSQVAGQIVQVAFTEGQNVKKGDLLFRIDPRPFEDALHQAEAAARRDQAQIAQLEASLARDKAQAEFAKTDATRYEQLQQAGVVSKSQYDQSRTNADVTREAAKATEASIASAHAALESDQAAIAAAKLNLSYCEILAPISGRTGNLLVHGGNIVKVNDVPLVVINQLAPIFVNFSVPEENLGAVRRLNAAQRLLVRVFPRDNPDHAEVGKLSVIDNTVDSTTGTIHLKATFDNRDGVLWPGQFVNVVLTLDTIRDAIVVPAEAVQNGQKGQFIYVVNADNKVMPHIVKVGRAFGKKYVIDQGLSAGDTVVIDGQMMLFPGAQVRIVDPGKVGLGQS